LIRAVLISIAGLSFFHSAQAGIVEEFEASCINDAVATAATPDLDKKRIWIQVNSDIDDSLHSYYGTVSGMLGEAITHSAHFTKWADKRQIYLTRYTYEGSFGITSHVCMVSDFARDSWEFPAGFETLIDGKVVDTAFSTVAVEGRKSVGQWRTVEDIRPISKITASAFLKDGPDHIASNFYGLQLTAVKTEIEETEDSLSESTVVQNVHEETILADEYILETEITKETQEEVQVEDFQIEEIQTEETPVEEILTEINSSDENLN